MEHKGDVGKFPTGLFFLNAGGLLMYLVAPALHFVVGPRRIEEPMLFVLLPSAVWSAVFLVVTLVTSARFMKGMDLAPAASRLVAVASPACVAISFAVGFLTGGTLGVSIFVVLVVILFGLGLCIRSVSRAHDSTP